MPVRSILCVRCCNGVRGVREPYDGLSRPSPLHCGRTPRARALLATLFRRPWGPPCCGNTPGRQLNSSPSVSRPHRRNPRGVHAGVALIAWPDGGADDQATQAPCCHTCPPSRAPVGSLVIPTWHTTRALVDLGDLTVAGSLCPRCDAFERLVQAPALTLPHPSAGKKASNAKLPSLLALDAPSASTQPPLHSPHRATAGTAPPTLRQAPRLRISRCSVEARPTRHEQRQRNKMLPRTSPRSRHPTFACYECKLSSRSKGGRVER